MGLICMMYSTMSGVKVGWWRGGEAFGLSRGRAAEGEPGTGSSVFRLVHHVSPTRRFIYLSCTVNPGTLPRRGNDVRPQR